MTEHDNASGENSFVGDERRHGFRFDRSISLGTVLTILTIFWASYASITRVIDQMKETEVRVNIMWQQFIQDHPEAVRYWRNGN